jgi:hypothetical protein
LISCLVPIRDIVSDCFGSVLGSLNQFWIWYKVLGLVPFADNFIRPVHYSVMVWPQIMFMVEILAFLLAYYSFVIATGFASSCED